MPARHRRPADRVDVPDRFEAVVSQPEQRHLGTVGQHLSRAHADFDPRAFGHQKLSTLVDEQPYLETRAEGSLRQVRLRSRRNSGRSKGD